MGFNVSVGHLCFFEGNRMKQPGPKMSTLKLSMQDKKDLDKFTKFLALKTAQIIVQSRSGEKVNTKCKPNSSGTDWVSPSLYDCFINSSRVSC